MGVRKYSKYKYNMGVRKYDMGVRKYDMGVRKYNTAFTPLGCRKSLLIIGLQADSVSCLPDHCQLPSSPGRRGNPGPRGPQQGLIHEQQVQPGRPVHLEHTVLVEDVLISGVIDAVTVGADLNGVLEYLR
jgi:hypothetical protein